MPYVYRYVNSDGKVVYVGKTIDIKKRDYQHVRNEKWCDETLSIQYVEVSNRAEMDMLEGWLISKYASKGECIYNQNKRWTDFGAMKHITVGNIKWIDLNRTESPQKVSDSIGNKKDQKNEEPDELRKLKKGDNIYIFLRPKESRNAPVCSAGEIKYRRVNRVSTKGKWVEDFAYIKFSLYDGREIYESRREEENDPVLATAFPSKKKVARMQADWITNKFGESAYRQFRKNTFDYLVEREKREEEWRRENPDIPMFVPLDILPDTPYIEMADILFQEVKGGRK